MKRFLSILLAALLALVCLSAAVAEEQEPVTLNVYCMAYSGSISGEWTDWCSGKLLEDLNLKLNFWPAGGEAKTKMRSYIAADSLPDLIIFNDQTIAQEAVDAGMLVKLSDYKDALPSIYEGDFFANANRYYTTHLSDGTGENQYVVPSQVGINAYNSHNWVPAIQWGAYRDAGTPELNTLEDYVTAFQAMSEVKPVNENGEKVYALSVLSDYSYIYAIDYLYGYCVVNSLMEIMPVGDDAGIVKLLSDESMYKRSLNFFRSVNQAGLLDPDSLTQTFDDVTAKINAGRVMFVPYSWWYGGYNTDARENDAENPDGIFSIPAKDMKIYTQPDNTIGRGVNFYAISNRSEHIDETVALLNWLYDLDVHQYFHMGPEGLLWEMVDGEPVMTETGKEVITGAEMPMDGGGTLAQARAMFNTIGQTDGTINPYTGQPIGYWHWRSYLEDDPTIAEQQVGEFFGNGSRVLQRYLEENDMMGYSVQATSMMPSIPDDLQLVASSIIETANTYSWQMVMASSDEEFEALWNTMLETVEGMGYDQVAEFYTNAWNEALEDVADYE